MDHGGGGIMRAAEPGAVHRTPEDVFHDFRARQKGLLKAFTTGNIRPLAYCFLWFLSIGFPEILTCFRRWCFSFFPADVDKFYLMCDPGEFPRPLPRSYSHTLLPELLLSAACALFSWFSAENKAFLLIA
jgi:hypothetical protein